MSEIYTAEEFAASFSLRGYGRKKAALKWLEENGMDTAEEADFERCYHALNQPVIWPRNGRYIALGSNGWNPIDPENLPNSRGETYNAMMCRAQREIDRLERAAKKRSNNDERSGT